MNNYFFLKTGYKIAAIVAVGLFIQLQLGCNLIKSSVSNNNSSANSSADNSGKSSNASESGSSGTPEVCRNSYYPVGLNVERKYHIKYQKMSNLDQDYTEKYSNFNGSEFVANTTFKDVTTTINWRCLPDGLLATQYNNSIDMKGGANAKIETLDSSGISFPAESRWNPGEKWTTVYNIKETIKGANSQAANTEASGKVNQDAEIISAEQITVPAGTFQTMKVKVKTTLDLTISVMGRSIPIKTNVETTAWFAKDVGMVKNQSSIAGLDSGTVELLSYAGTK